MLPFPFSMLLLPFRIIKWIYRGLRKMYKFSAKQVKAIDEKREQLAEDEVKGKSSSKVKKLFLITAKVAIFVVAGLFVLTLTCTMCTVCSSIKKISDFGESSRITGQGTKRQREARQSSVEKLPVCPDSPQLYTFTTAREIKVSAQPDCWSGMIMIPSGQEYRLEAKGKIVVLFIDGSKISVSNKTISLMADAIKGSLRVLAVGEPADVLVSI